jgi:hypothetical protein
VAAALELPGFRVVREQPPAAEAGLRNDVAAFLGRTERGPLGVPVRVTSRQAYATTFGGVRRDLAAPRAVEAYFANDGQIAWVVRVGRNGETAGAEVELGAVAGGTWVAGGPARLTLPGNRLQVTATSPGSWADGTRVRVTYRAFGPVGEPELDVQIAVPGEPLLHRSGIAPAELPAVVAAAGLLTAGFAGDPVAAEPPGGPTAGPAATTWYLELDGGTDPTATVADLLDATDAQAEIDEIALVCAPGLEDDLGSGGHDEVVAALARAAAAGQDRLLVLATDAMRPAELAAVLARLDQAVPDPHLQRAVALYAPALIADALTPGPDRYVPVDPVGHVCGIVSRLDRERGSGSAPANVLVSDAIDVTTGSTADEQAIAVGRQVNLLRCRVGGGLEVWGARTLDRGEGRHIPHRRLVHRIVRAIRRVADPLVFDVNGPVLWFAVARAISGVLMEAFRSGFLQGETPDQAYRVRCDETTNTQDRIDAGEVVCEIELAPAAPMEFITLRLTLGAQGLLEVVEQ